MAIDNGATRVPGHLGHRSDVEIVNGPGTGEPVRSRRRTVTRADLERRLGPVLDGLAYPAHRWQVLAAAEYYGADGATLSILYSLRATRFSTFGDVVDDILTGNDVRSRLAGR